MLRAGAPSDVVCDALGWAQVDLVADEEAIAQVEAAITFVNPTVSILRCQQARVDLDRILGLRCFDTGTVCVCASVHGQSGSCG